MRYRGRQYDGACFCDNNIFIIILMFFTWENINFNVLFCIYNGCEQHSGGVSCVPTQWCSGYNNLSKDD